MNSITDTPLGKVECPTVSTCNPAGNNMLLHIGDREFILFSFWKTGSSIGLFGSCLLVILLCILHEAIDLVRNFLAKERALTHRDSDSYSVHSVSSSVLRWNKLKRAFTSYRFTQAILYGIHTTIGYILILIIVSFNFWLILAVGIGKSIGYFLFTGSPVVEKTSIALTSNSPRWARQSDIHRPYSITSTYVIPNGSECS